MQIHGQYITLDDGNTLHVVTSGSESAPPLLMLHCWSGNWTQWETVMCHLNGKFRFIVPDQLGFGNSPKPAGNHYQIDKQAHRAHQILHYFGYDHATVIGHSMGGMIGLTLAGLYPDTVDKLIVIDPAVTGRMHPFSKLLTFVLALGRWNITAPFELSIKLGLRFPVLSLPIVKVFFANPVEFLDETMYWSHQIIADGQLYSSVWSQKAIIEWDTTPLLPKITAPILALWGEEDYTIPISECDVLAKHVTDFRAVTFPDVGHFPMIEAWDAAIRVVELFLIE